MSRSTFAFLVILSIFLSSGHAILNKNMPVINKNSENCDCTQAFSFLQTSQEDSSILNDIHENHIPDVIKQKEYLREIISEKCQNLKETSLIQNTVHSQSLTEIQSSKLKALIENKASANDETRFYSQNLIREAIIQLLQMNDENSFCEKGCSEASNALDLHDSFVNRIKDSKTHLNNRIEALSSFIQACKSDSTLLFDQSRAIPTSATQAINNALGNILSTDSSLSTAVRARIAGGSTQNNLRNDQDSLPASVKTPAVVQSNVPVAAPVTTVSAPVITFIAPPPKPFSNQVMTPSQINLKLSSETVVDLNNGLKAQIEVANNLKINLDNAKKALDALNSQLVTAKDPSAKSNLQNSIQLRTAANSAWSNRYNVELLQVTLIQIIINIKIQIDITIDIIVKYKQRKSSLDDSSPHILIQEIDQGLLQAQQDLAALILMRIEVEIELQTQIQLSIGYQSDYASNIKKLNNNPEEDNQNKQILIQLQNLSTNQNNQILILKHNYQVQYQIVILQQTTVTSNANKYQLQPKENLDSQIYIQFLIELQSYPSIPESQYPTFLNAEKPNLMISFQQTTIKYITIILIRIQQEKTALQNLQNIPQQSPDIILQIQQKQNLIDSLNGYVAPLNQGISLIRIIIEINQYYQYISAPNSVPQPDSSFLDAEAQFSPQNVPSDYVQNVKIYMILQIKLQYYIKLIVYLRNSISTQALSSLPSSLQQPDIPGIQTQITAFIKIVIILRQRISQVQTMLDTQNVPTFQQDQNTVYNLIIIQIKYQLVIQRKTQVNLSIQKYTSNNQPFDINTNVNENMLSANQGVDDIGIAIKQLQLVTVLSKSQAQVQTPDILQSQLTYIIQYIIKIRILIETQNIQHKQLLYALDTTDNPSDRANIQNQINIILIYITSLQKQQDQIQQIALYIKILINIQIKISNLPPLTSTPNQPDQLIETEQPDSSILSTLTQRMQMIYLIKVRTIIITKYIILLQQTMDSYIPQAQIAYVNLQNSPDNPQVHTDYQNYIQILIFINTQKQMSQSIIIYYIQQLTKQVQIVAKVQNKPINQINQQIENNIALLQESPDGQNDFIYEQISSQIQNDLPNNQNYFPQTIISTKISIIVKIQIRYETLNIQLVSLQQQLQQESDPQIKQSLDSQIQSINVIIILLQKQIKVYKQIIMYLKVLISIEARIIDQNNIISSLEGSLSQTDQQNLYLSNNLSPNSPIYIIVQKIYQARIQLIVLIKIRSEALVNYAQLLNSNDILPNIPNEESGFYENPNDISNEFQYQIRLITILRITIIMQTTKLTVLQSNLQLPQTPNYLQQQIQIIFLQEQPKVINLAYSQADSIIENQLYPASTSSFSPSKRYITKLYILMKIKITIETRLILIAQLQEDVSQNPPNLFELQNQLANAQNTLADLQNNYNTYNQILILLRIIIQIESEIQNINLAIQNTPGYNLESLSYIEGESTPSQDYININSQVYPQYKRLIVLMKLRIMIEIRYTILIQNLTVPDLDNSYLSPNQEYSETQMPPNTQYNNQIIYIVILRIKLETQIRRINMIIQSMPLQQRENNLDIWYLQQQDDYENEAIPVAQNFILTAIESKLSNQLPKLTTVQQYQLYIKVITQINIIIQQRMVIIAQLQDQINSPSGSPQLIAPLQDQLNHENQYLVIIQQKYTLIRKILVTIRIIIEIDKSVSNLQNDLDNLNPQFENESYPNLYLEGSPNFETPSSPLDYNSIYLIQVKIIALIRIKITYLTRIVVLVSNPGNQSMLQTPLDETDDFPEIGNMISDVQFYIIRLIYIKVKIQIITQVALKFQNRAGLGPNENLVNQNVDSEYVQYIPLTDQQAQNHLDDDIVIQYNQIVPQIPKPDVRYNTQIILIIRLKLIIETKQAIILNLQSQPQTPEIAAQLATENQNLIYLQTQHDNLMSYTINIKIIVVIYQQIQVLIANLNSLSPQLTESYVPQMTPDLVNQVIVIKKQILILIRQRILVEIKIAMLLKSQIDNPPQPGSEYYLVDSTPNNYLPTLQQQYKIQIILITILRINLIRQIRLIAYLEYQNLPSNNYENLVQNTENEIYMQPLEDIPDQQIIVELEIQTQLQNQIQIQPAEVRYNIQLQKIVKVKVMIEIIIIKMTQMQAQIQAQGSSVSPTLQAEYTSQNNQLSQLQSYYESQKQYIIILKMIIIIQTQIQSQMVIIANLLGQQTSNLETMNFNYESLPTEQLQPVYQARLRIIILIKIRIQLETQVANYINQQVQTPYHIDNLESGVDDIEENYPQQYQDQLRLIIILRIQVEVKTRYIIILIQKMGSPELINNLQINIENQIPIIQAPIQTQSDTYYNLDLEIEYKNQVATLAKPKDRYINYITIIVQIKLLIEQKTILILQIKQQIQTSNSPDQLQIQLEEEQKNLDMLINAYEIHKGISTTLAIIIQINIRIIKEINKLELLMNLPVSNNLEQENYLQYTEAPTDTSLATQIAASRKVIILLLQIRIQNEIKLANLYSTPVDNDVYQLIYTNPNDNPLNKFGSIDSQYQLQVRIIVLLRIKLQIQIKNVIAIQNFIGNSMTEAEIQAEIQPETDQIQTLINQDSIIYWNNDLNSQLTQPSYVVPSPVARYNQYITIIIQIRMVIEKKYILLAQLQQQLEAPDVSDTSNLTSQINQINSDIQRLEAHYTAQKRIIIILKMIVLIQNRINNILVTLQTGSEAPELEQSLPQNYLDDLPWMYPEQLANIYQSQNMIIILINLRIKLETDYTMLLYTQIQENESETTSSELESGESYQNLPYLNQAYQVQIKIILYLRIILEIRTNVINVIVAKLPPQYLQPTQIVEYTLPNMEIEFATQAEPEVDQNIQYSIYPNQNSDNYLSPESSFHQYIIIIYQINLKLQYQKVILAQYQDQLKQNPALQPDLGPKIVHITLLISQLQQNYEYSQQIALNLRIILQISEKIQYYIYLIQQSSPSSSFIEGFDFIEQMPTYEGEAQPIPDQLNSETQNPIQFYQTQIAILLRIQIQIRIKIAILVSNRIQNPTLYQISYPELLDEPIQPEVTQPQTLYLQQINIIMILRIKLIRQYNIIVLTSQSSPSPLTTSDLTNYVENNQNVIYIQILPSIQQAFYLELQNQVAPQDNSPYFPEDRYKVQFNLIVQIKVQIDQIRNGLVQLNQQLQSTNDAPTRLSLNNQINDLTIKVNNLQDQYNSSRMILINIKMIIIIQTRIILYQKLLAQYESNPDQILPSELQETEIPQNIPIQETIYWIRIQIIILLQTRLNLETQNAISSNLLNSVPQPLTLSNYIRIITIIQIQIEYRINYVISIQKRIGITVSTAQISQLIASRPYPIDTLRNNVQTTVEQEISVSVQAQNPQTNIQTVVDTQVNTHTNVKYEGDPESGEIEEVKAKVSVDQKTSIDPTLNVVSAQPSSVSSSDSLPATGTNLRVPASQALGQTVLAPNLPSQPALKMADFSHPVLSTAVPLASSANVSAEDVRFSSFFAFKKYKRRNH